MSETFKPSGLQSHDTLTGERHDLSSDRVRVQIGPSGLDYIEIFIDKHDPQRVEVRCGEGVIDIRPNVSNSISVGVHPRP